MAIDMGFTGGRQALRVRLPARAVLVALAVVVVAGIAIALMSTTGGSGGYTSADRAQFVAGCTRNGGATAAQCGCMFSRISARLPYAAYTKAAGKAWSPQTSRVFAEAVTACASGPQPAASSS